MKTLRLILVVLISFSLVSCMNTEKSKKENKAEVEEPEDGLKQKENDLLAGISSAICYSGFSDGQHPDRGEGAVNPSYDETLEDLNVLLEGEGFKLIRLYDSGKNSEMVLRVIDENNLDIKVMLGIWLKAELSNHEGCGWLTEPIPEDELESNKVDNLDEIEKGVALANQYKDIIVAVNVGNEALVEWNDHMVEVETVISYVRQVKNSIGQKVTVADNYKWWATSGSELAQVVDFIAIHLYPLWEGKDINEGMSFSIANVEEVKDSLPDSKIVITEVGWATVAVEFGERASEDKQLQYYNEFMQWSKEMNYTTFFFEAFDENWKGNPDNPMGAEKHWGLYKADRKPKKVMKQNSENKN